MPTWPYPSYTFITFWRCTLKLNQLIVDRVRSLSRKNKSSPEETYCGSLLCKAESQHALLPLPESRQKKRCPPKESRNFSPFCSLIKIFRKLSAKATFHDNFENIICWSQCKCWKGENRAVPNQGPFFFSSEKKKMPFLLVKVTGQIVGLGKTLVVWNKKFSMLYYHLSNC